MATWPIPGPLECVERSPRERGSRGQSPARRRSYRRYLNVPNLRQIWIAGGIGVTPFLSMARSLGGSAREIDFYYCTEGPEHAHYLAELFIKADAHPWFRVVPVRTRSLGRISARDIVGVSRPIEHDAAVLICGPPEMIANLTTQFLEMEVPRSQLYFEDFSFMRGR